MSSPRSEPVGRSFCETSLIQIKVANKANPWNPAPELKGLTADSVAKQWAATEKNLGMKAIDLYYLHAPDHNTPIEQTLEAIDKLHKGWCLKLQFYEGICSCSFLVCSFALLIA